MFAARVRESVRATLDGGIHDQKFRGIVAKALGTYPYALHPRSPLRAARLTLGSFQAAGGTGESGIAAAAAMEMMTAALHLFDGVADRDAEGSSADLQVAIALQFLMGHALERSRTTRPPGAAAIDWASIYALMATVSSGQQRDIDLQAEARPSLEDAKVMTIEKTGAYGEALALTGAIAAGAPPDVRADLAQLGQYMGVRGQLIDDASDASMAAPNTSDISLRKKTLPIVFFLEGRGGDAALDVLRDRYLSNAPLSADDEVRIRRAVDEGGGVQFALTLAAWYRMKAMAVTQLLQTQGHAVQLLLDYMAEVDKSAAGSTQSSGPA